MYQGVHIFGFKIRSTVMATILVYCISISIDYTSGGNGFSMIDKLVAGGGSEIDKFHYIPVLFFRFLKSVGIPPILFSTIVSAGIVMYLFWDEKYFFKYILKIFLISPALILYLGDPRKELFQFIFLCIFYKYALLNKNYMAASSIFIYAILFRYHYIVLSIATFLEVLKRKKTRNLYIAICAFISFLSLLAFQEQLFVFLKDLVERRDVGYSIHYGDVRTAFKNPVIIEDWWSLGHCYFTAIIRLNFPLYFSFNIREILMQFYIIVFFVVLFARWSVAMHVSVGIIWIIMIFWIYEPDYGSYLRHISSLCPLLFILTDIETNHSKSVVHS